MSEFFIADRRIGKGHPVYVIAEMSANHGQSFDQAMEIVETAAASGADAIKLQTYTPDTITLDCDRPCFKIGKGTIWEGRRLYDLYKDAYTPWEWQPELKKKAEQLGMHCFSSPFDATAVDFLEGMDVPAYKIASFENVDIPLIEKVAATGKPLIISTGMATEMEIREAVNAARGAGCRHLALLKCTSAYPAVASEMNLRTIPDMRERFGVEVGLSDHTLGIAVPVSAVALGAVIIEKHFTLSRSAGGPDAAFSLEPHEFSAMVEAVRIVGEALGRPTYEISPRESASRGFRRSLFAVKDIAEGALLSEDNVRSIRPADGLPPKHYREVLGKKARRAIARGEPLSWDIIG